MSRHLVLAIAAGAVDVGAMGFIALTAHATACAAVPPGAGGGASLPVAVCGVLALPPFTPAAALGLALSVLFGLVPLVTLRTRRRWPCAASAAGQVVLQVASLGLFLPWVPTLLLTAAAALA